MAQWTIRWCFRTKRGDAGDCSCTRLAWHSSPCDSHPLYHAPVVGSSQVLKPYCAQPAAIARVLIDELCGVQYVLGNAAGVDAGQMDACKWVFEDLHQHLALDTMLC